MRDGESRSVLAAWMGRRLRRHTAWRVLGQFLLYEKGGIRGGPRPTNYSRPAGGTALCQARDVLHRWRTCLRIARYVASACARIRSDLWRSSARLKRAPPRRWRPRMAAGAAMGRSVAGFRCEKCLVTQPRFYIARCRIGRVE